MTLRIDALRAGLAEIAEQAAPTDLHERATARSRQITRRRAAFASAAAVFLVTAGAVALRQVTHTTAAPVPPASAASTSPAPTTPVTTTPVPDASTDLSNATLVIPQWPVATGVGPCPTGNVRFTDGALVVEPDQSINVHIERVVDLDADGNGTRDHVVTIVCFGPAERSTTQLVAYRAAGTGALPVIGRVIATGGEIDMLGTVVSASADGGALKVTVIHQVVAGSAPPDYSFIDQERTYSWEGNRFHQTGGLTTFVADPAVADVSATASRLVLRPTVNNCVTGTLSVTVRNDGPQDVTGLSAVVMVPFLEEWCATAEGQNSQSYLRPLGGLRAGESTTFSITVLTNARSATADPRVIDNPADFVAIRTAGGQQYAKTSRVVIEYE